MGDSTRPGGIMIDERGQKGYHKVEREKPEGQAPGGMGACLFHFGLLFHPEFLLNQPVLHNIMPKPAKPLDLSTLKG